MLDQSVLPFGKETNKQTDILTLVEGNKMAEDGLNRMIDKDKLGMNALFCL